MFDHLEDPVIVLSTAWHHHIGLITNIPDGINVVFNMNSYDEISFDVHKEWDNNTCLVWDDIVSFKYVYIPDYKKYYEIYVSVDETDSTVKHITGKTAGEVELSNRKLIDFHCNDETDILSDDYDADMPTLLYREILPTDSEEMVKKKKRSSLLHRVLSTKCPDWGIGKVSKSIRNIQRTFSVSNSSIYDFLTNTVGKEINCLFEFDSDKRLLNAYDLYNTCNGCGYRGDFIDECPKCGSKNISIGYGRKTGIFLNTSNYATEISLSGNTDNVKNCLRMVAGDQLMTASVINLNPNGSQYVYHFSDFMLKDMPAELVDKLRSYNELYDSVIDDYNALTKDWYNLTDEILDLKHTMMPETPIPGETTAEEQLAILEASFTRELNPETVAVNKISNASPITATNAVKGMARVLVDPRYTVDIVEKSDSLSQEINGSRTWSGKFIVTSLGATRDQTEEEKDQATSVNAINVTINGDYEEFVSQKIQKSLDRTDASFMTLFDIEDDDEFKEELTKYCLERLKSFLNSYNSVCEVITGNGINATNVDSRDYFGVDLYEEMYMPYYNRSVAIQKELDNRAKEVADKEKELNDVDSRRNEIKSKLNIYDYLGEELYKTLYMYLKEDEYNNSNYISTGLDTVDILDRAMEFFEMAQDEVEKASNIELTITISLNNMINMKEFRDFKGKFEIGDWLVTEVDGLLYRLRLINVSFNYSSPNTITFTFANIDRMKSISDEIGNIINSAQSMSGSYNYVAHQAKQGNDANDDIEEMKDTGVDSSTYNIVAGTNRGIVIDEHGILMRSYDDIEGKFDPAQTRINNNSIEFTDNAWETVKAAVGKISYTLDGEKYERYGVNAETLIAGMMIAGYIYSNNYSSSESKGTFFDLNTGDFSIGGGKIQFTARNNTLNMRNLNMRNSEIYWDSVNAPTINEIDDLSAQLASKQDKLIPGTNIRIEDNVISADVGDVEANPQDEVDDVLMKIGIDNVVYSIGVLAGLADVIITNPTDGQTITYDAQSQKWVNGNSSGCSHIVDTIPPTNDRGHNGDFYTQYGANGIIAFYQKINGTWLPFPMGGGGSTFTLLNITEGDTMNSEITIEGEVNP